MVLARRDERGDGGAPAGPTLAGRATGLDRTTRSGFTSRRRGIPVAPLVVLAFLVARTASADVRVTASVEPKQIGVGEVASLDVAVDGADNAAVPEIPAVDGLSVRYVGPSTQVSFVNGQVSRSETHRFSVSASRPGAFTIGPLAVVVGGKRYEAAAVTLNVASAGAARPGPAGTSTGDQLRLVLAAGKSEVYLHERIPLRLELWVGNVRVSGLQYPAIPGDGVAIEKLPEEPTQRREGTFQIVQFATTLTPLRTGALTVGPATMALNLIVRARGGDPFFGGIFGDSQRPLELHSEPLALNVLPLPDAGRPADFSGAVGRFDVDVAAAPLALAAGDPVTVTWKLRGTGSLEGVTPPAIAASDALRVYPLQTSGQASAGERGFEQVVIPLRPGTVGLPETRFSYFDPEARAYRTIVRPPIALAVRAPVPGSATPEVVGAVAPKPRVEELGRDIVFIKDDPGTLVPAATATYRRASFWVLLAVPFAVWVGAVVYDRRRRRLRGDVRYARFTRAGRAARTAIAGARQKLGAGDHVAFYDAVARAMTEYLAAKLDLPPGAVTADAVADRLSRHAIAPQVAHDLEAFFATCEQARFAPASDGQADVERTLARADAIVRALERERRLGRAVAAALVLVAVCAASARAAAPPDSPKTIFFRANALYAEEHYAEAAALYEQLVAAGLASGNLYFNLGNAYFKTGDVGRAILEYERARRRIPGDPDLRANLGHARSVAGASDEPFVWARLLFPLADRFSTGALLLAASALYAVGMLLLAAARLAERLARVARAAALVAGVALAVLVPSLVYRLATVDLPDYAVVVAPADATVRFEPSPGGTVHFASKPGTVLRVVGTREGWVQVMRDDGRRGWVERAVVETL